MSIFNKKLELVINPMAGIQWDSLKATYQQLTAEPVTDSQFITWLLAVIYDQHDLTIAGAK
jgi:hypothetical protein